jgi:hypothetical protein
MGILAVIFKCLVEVLSNLGYIKLGSRNVQKMDKLFSKSV